MQNISVTVSCNYGRHAFNRKSSMATFAMGPEDRGPWYGDMACEGGGDVFGTLRQKTFSEAAKVSLDGTF